MLCGDAVRGAVKAHGRTPVGTGRQSALLPHTSPTITILPHTIPNQSPPAHATWQLPYPNSSHGSSHGSSLLPRGPQRPDIDAWGLREHLAEHAARACSNGGDGDGNTTSDYSTSSTRSARLCIGIAAIAGEACGAGFLACGGPHCRSALLVGAGRTVGSPARLRVGSTGPPHGPFAAVVCVLFLA